MNTKTLLPCLVLGVACAAPQRNVRFHDHDIARAKKDGKPLPAPSITSFSTPADLRLGFLRTFPGGAHYCAEPMPDVALGSEASGSGSLAASAMAAQSAALSQENERLRSELQRSKTSSKAAVQQQASGDIDLTATARLAISVAEMGGRTQQVLLAREFLYRICEARANGFFEDGKTYVDLQMSALKMIEAIETAKSKALVTSSAAANAELLKQINAYNDGLQKHCEQKFKSCEAAATNDPEKKACATSRQTCENAIKPIVPPASWP